MTRVTQSKDGPNSVTIDGKELHQVGGVPGFDIFADWKTLAAPYYLVKEGGTATIGEFTDYSAALTAATTEYEAANPELAATPDEDKQVLRFSSRVGAGDQSE